MTHSSDTHVWSQMLSALALLLCVIAPAISVEAQTPKQGASLAGDVERGKQAYIKHGCFRCHGYSGDGGAGPCLAQNPIAFQAFRQYVRRPKRSMPPYGTHVSDTELADMYVYVKATPASPDPKTIPLLNEKER